MTVKCPHCRSVKVQSRGAKVTQSGETKRRYQCNNCSKWFNQSETNKFSAPVAFADHKKFVITGLQNDAQVNYEFYEALKKYCEINKAKLIVVPITYLNGVKKPSWKLPEDQLTRNTVTLCPKLRLLGDININPAIENPVSGLDYLSKGDSLLIAHPQLQMKTLAVNSVDSAAIISTTGVISKPSYSRTKQGEKARFNHSFSAVVIEVDEEVGFHWRILNADDQNGFYDIDGYYTKSGRTAIDHVEAIVTGDEHAMFADPKVKDATYLNRDSMVKMLRPKQIIRHDVLDCYTISHHHAKSFFTRYGKFHANQHKIEDELTLTLDYILDTTPKGVLNVIVDSNHNNHLTQWLNTADPRVEPWNAKTYHELMYLMLESMEVGEDSFKYMNPFALWIVNHNHGRDASNILFLEKSESYKIGGIEVSNHGDAGTNGARGSIKQYSRLAHKQVIGHSHSPGIDKGTYQVGTSSKLKLEYVSGPSSWLQTHCVIYPNGKRQLINVIGGKWKA